MNTKKRLSFICAAALIMTMTGCGSSSDAKSTETKATTTTAATTTTTAAETTAAETKKTTEKAEEETSSKAETTKSESKKKKKAEDSSSEKDTKDDSSSETEKEKEDKPADSSETEAPKKDSGSSDAETYMYAVRDAFKAFSTPMTGTYLEAIQNNDFETARKALDEAAAGLDTIEGIKAPAKYADMQADLVGTLADERKTLDYMRQYTDFCEKYRTLEAKESPSEEELKELQAMTEEMTKLNETIANSQSEFSPTFINIIKTVKADIDG